MRKLASYGADLDLVDNNGQTPLFYAIKNGKSEAIEYLLQQGVSLTTTDKKNFNPVTWAKRSNKT
jgi:ankyrin repeat protein